MVEEPTPGGPCAVGRYIFPKIHDGKGPCPAPASILLAVFDMEDISNPVPESNYGMCDYHGKLVIEYATARENPFTPESLDALFTKLEGEEWQTDD